MTGGTTIDENIVRRAADGDADAFVDLYKGIYKDLYRYAYFLLGRKHDAEDVVQDACLDAWKGIRLLKEPKAFRSWMFRILHIKCSRQRMAYMTEPEELSVEPMASPDESEATIMSMLSGVSEDERNIILLHVLGGFRTGEIARLLSMKPGTVRSKESRALKKLREKEDLL